MCTGAQVTKRVEISSCFLFKRNQADPGGIENYFIPPRGGCIHDKNKEDFAAELSLVI